MIAKLMTLLDEPRGGAWPSSARTVRRPVKSGNERDPYPLFVNWSLRGLKPIKGTAADKAEEGAVNGRSVCPESPGLHASYNA